MSYAAHFSRFLRLTPQPLYFTPHRLHPLPDVSFEAQQQAWLDSAVDTKTERLPQAFAHIASCLNLPNVSTLRWRASAEPLLTPLLDAGDAKPIQVLCMDPLPPALAPTLLRLETLGRVRLTRLHAEPFKSFEARWSVTLRKGDFDWVCLTQCCSDTAFVPTGLTALARSAADRGARVLIDGSRSFMAMDTDLSDIVRIASYVAAAPAYAMSGAGYAFLHCAETSALDIDSDVALDPTPPYRFIAAMDWIRRQTLTPALIHGHIGGLQARLLSALDAMHLPLSRHNLLPPLSNARGNFLSFELVDADRTQRALATHGAMVDADAGHLRIGFGIYHSSANIDALLATLRDVLT